MSTDVRSAILTCNLQKLKGKLGGSGRARAGRWAGGEGGRPTPPQGARVPQGCARGRGGRADAPLRTVARTAPSEPAAAARWAAAGNLPGVVLGVVGAARGAWAPICLHSGAPPPPHPRHTEPHSEAERSGGRLRAPDLRPSSPRLLPPPGGCEAPRAPSRASGESPSHVGSAQLSPAASHTPRPRPPGPSPPLPLLLPTPISSSSSPLLPAHVGRSSRTSCNQCGDVTHPVRFPPPPTYTHTPPVRARTLGPPRQRDPPGAAREPRDSRRGGAHVSGAGSREVHPESAQITWAGCGGGGRRGELSPGGSPGGEAAAPRTPLVRASHSSSRVPAPDPEVAPAARPASVPRFPATARKFRSRTPGAHPHPAVPETPGIGGASGWRRHPHPTPPHKHQPQVLFSLRAASSLAPAPHRARPARLPALPRQRYGAVPAKVILEL